MRTLKLLATTMLVASLAATPLAALAGNGKGNGGRPDTAGVSATVLVPLTVDEIATLLWMREEEKLARDVYIKMTEYYPVDDLLEHRRGRAEALRCHRPEARTVRDSGRRAARDRCFLRPGPAGNV